MKKLLLFLLLVTPILKLSLSQEIDSLVSIPNLNAFSHPEFFYSWKCDCCRYDFDLVYMQLYDTSTNFTVGSALPPNFDVGYPVTIIAKQGVFFRIIFEEGIPQECEQHLVGKEYCVKKGTLGTWLSNYNNNGIYSYDPVPLYESPSLNSNIVTQVEPGVAIILDIEGDWMFIEIIGKGNNKGKRGWLDPKMQCGNPYGFYSGYCNDWK
jgi:hypothetical protein